MAQQASRFDYVKYDGIAADKQAQLKRLFTELEGAIESLLPGARSKALVMTKLEEAYMWCGKGIRDEQVEKRSSELQEERNDQ